MSIDCLLGGMTGGKADAYMALALPGVNAAQINYMALALGDLMLLMFL